MAGKLGPSNGRRRTGRELSKGALELIAARFRVLGEPMRLKLLHTLGNEEKTVSQLVAETGAGQANVSKHLGLLADAGVVSRRKEGLNTFYRVADERIFDMCEAVCSSLGERLAEDHGVITRFREQRH
jgi:DNA-binding transcriptional ArsR family regulator